MCIYIYIYVFFVAHKVDEHLYMSKFMPVLRPKMIYSVCVYIYIYILVCDMIIYVHSENCQICIVRLNLTSTAQGLCEKSCSWK